MGKIVAVAERKKKKKGRPSLLDLQKRNLLQQQESEKKRNPNPNHGSNYGRRSPNPKPDPTPRRITRRQSSQIESKEAEDDADGDSGDDDDDEEEKKEKKLKLVVRLTRSSNLRSLESSRDHTDADDSGSASNDESENGEKPLKKRKIDSVSEVKKARVCNVGAGEAGSAHEKAEKRKNDQKGGVPPPAGAPSGSVSASSLPNVKLLFFILERLQKKDTYGVFSEPVDPEELPDYHDIIEHPMDFGTVRKKLTTGVYTTLEQFEGDVFLICSNAMHYNAPETIYFKQARSIQELAKKTFQNLRQDGHGMELDSKPQRGRPSLVKKFLQQSGGKPLFESDSDAALANAGDNSNWSNASNDAMKRASAAEKPSSFPDASGRPSFSLRNSDSSTSLAENKNEASGFSLRGINLKLGRKPFISEENRRATYKLSSQLAARPDSVFNVFDSEKKQLIPVGLHLEHAYARSLARFAATLGPVAWKVAACKIQRALPPGMRFGPGWVGDAEAPPSRKSPVKAAAPAVTVTAPTVDSKPDAAETHEVVKSPRFPGHPTPKMPAGYMPAVNQVIDAKEGTANARLLNKENSKASLNPVTHCAKLPFQQPLPSGLHPQLNGFTSGFSLPQFVNQGTPGIPAIRPIRHQQNLKPGMEAVSSSLPDMVARNNIVLLAPSKQLEPEQPGPCKEDGKASKRSSDNPKPQNPVAGSSYSDTQAGNGRVALAQASWRGLMLHQKQDSSPPDLNIGFQSPSSPARQNSGVLMDSQQPDLALQL